jgi:hypothetical protein
VTTFTTTASIYKPRRLFFGSNGMLYVLQGDSSLNFELLALLSDGSVTGSATQSTMGAAAFHEKTQLVYWWDGSSNQIQAFTTTLTAVGNPITLPSGPTFVDPGYLAVDPTGEILYYNHDGSSDIFRLQLSTPPNPLTPISEPELLEDPAEMVLNNRGHLFVAQSTAQPVLEFDSDGNLVTGSVAYNFTANTTLSITRASRTPLLDPEEAHPHNCNIEPLDELGIPTVSAWGMVVMTLLVLTAGALVFMRRRPAYA